MAPRPSDSARRGGGIDVVGVLLEDVGALVASQVAMLPSAVES
jgi:hypothetical protein